jgi:FkbM family methyltransferase
MTMILSTRRLFLALLPALDIDTVCDVGSMNGADALAFRRAVPRARVLAFEPNPHNVRLMENDSRLREHGIELMPFAACEQDGVAAFHLVKTDYALPHHRRGMSSLLERDDRSLRDSTASVATVRLDRCLAAAAPHRMALWIDVEGKAFEALEGARGILSQVMLLHVEVETLPCIAAGQKLYPQIRALLESEGFVELATDRAPQAEQLNVLFVRREMTHTERLRTRWRAYAEVGRRRIVALVGLVCPRCLRIMRRLARA